MSALHPITNLFQYFSPIPCIVHLHGTADEGPLFFTKPGTTVFVLSMYWTTIVLKKSVFTRVHIASDMKPIWHGLGLKCDGTRAENRFRLSAKRTNPFKPAEASVQSTTGSRDVRISGSNAGYTMFRGSVKGTGYPLHSPVSASLPLPRITACHHISTGLQ